MTDVPEEDAKGHLQDLVVNARFHINQMHDMFRTIMRVRFGEEAVKSLSDKDIIELHDIFFPHPDAFNEDDFDTPEECLEEFNKSVQDRREVIIRQRPNLLQLLFAGRSDEIGMQAALALMDAKENGVEEGISSHEFMARYCIKDLKGDLDDFLLAAFRFRMEF